LQRRRHSETSFEIRASSSASKLMANLSSSSTMRFKVDFHRQIRSRSTKQRHDLFLIFMRRVKSKGRHGKENGKHGRECRPSKTRTAHSRSQETKAVRLYGPIECHARRDGWRCQSGIQRIFLFGSDLTAEIHSERSKGAGLRDNGMGWNANGRENSRHEFAHAKPTPRFFGEHRL
jgi:hypothetical protein